MDNDQEIRMLLQKIRHEQLREAQRAQVRWTRLTVASAVALLVALPAIWSYLHHLLVIWF